MLIAVKPMKKNIQLEPVWTIDVLSASQGTTETEIFPFKLGETIGYFTPSGKIFTIKHLDPNQKAAISKELYACYENNSTSIDFYFPKGKTGIAIKTAGFPYFDDDRIFILHPNGTSFSVHNKDGRERWRFEYYCPITSIGSNNDSVAVGYADGIIVIFDNYGNKIHEIQPAGSEFEVIFGTGISNSSSYVACISGVDTQRLIISDIRESTNKIIYHEYVEKEVFEQSLVQFSENEEYVFFNPNGNLVAVSIEEKKSAKIPVAGKIMQIKEVLNGEYYFVLSKNDGIATVTILNENMYTVGDFSFTDEKAFIDTDLNSLYVGNGS